MWNPHKHQPLPPLSNKHWALLGLVAIFLTSLFYNVLLNPVLQKQEKLKKHHHQILTELHALQQYQTHQNQLENQSNQVQTQIQFMEQMFPVSWEIGKVTAHLLEAVEASQMRLLRQTIDPEAHLNHYTELVIRWELEGHYGQLQALMQQLTLLPFLVNVQKLAVINPALTSRQPSLKVQMHLSIYRRRPA